MDRGQIQPFEGGNVSISTDSTVRHETGIQSVRKVALKSEVIRLARRHRAAAIPVESQDRPRRLIGYVRIVDLHLDQEKNIVDVRPLIEINKSQTLIDALMIMRGRREALAQVVGDDGQNLGLLNTRGLIESLFRGE